MNSRQSPSWAWTLSSKLAFNNFEHAIRVATFSLFVLIVFDLVDSVGATILGAILVLGLLVLDFHRNRKDWKKEVRNWVLAIVLVIVYTVVVDLFI